MDVNSIASPISAAIESVYSLDATGLGSLIETISLDFTYNNVHGIS